VDGASLHHRFLHLCDHDQGSKVRLCFCVNVDPPLAAHFYMSTFSPQMGNHIIAFRVFNPSLTFPFLRTFVFCGRQTPLSLSNSSPTTSWIASNAEGPLKGLYPARSILIRIHRDRVYLDHSDARLKNQSSLPTRYHMHEDDV
jgi:hypothetical protein